VFGSVLLFDRDDAEYFADQELVVSWEIVVPLALVMTGAAVALAWKLRRSQARSSPTGTSGLVGAHGVALEDVGPERGSVRVGSERWSARADARIPAESPIEVVGIDGLELRVRRAAAGERRASRGAEEKGTNT
jgi:membrane-bound ClpP family serine protease